MEKIAGLWKGQKAIPFVGSGEGTVSISADGSAKGCCIVHFMGKDHRFQADTIHIEPLGQGKYTGTYLGKTVELSLSSSGNVLFIRVNPFKLGIVDNPKFNLYFPIQLTRGK